MVSYTHEIKDILQSVFPYRVLFLYLYTTLRWGIRGFVLVLLWLKNSTVLSIHIPKPFLMDIKQSKNLFPGHTIHKLMLVENFEA